MKKITFFACVLLFAAVGCQATATPTPIPPTETAAPPTATAVPPTAAIPPTATALPPTATSLPPPTARPTATPKPHETLITFDDSVPGPQRVYLKDFFDMARREMGDAGDVAVFASYDISKLPKSSYDWDNALTVSYSGGRIAVNARNLEANLSDPESLGVMLIAYYFLVEDNLSGANSNPSPQWLIYGSANYVAYSTYDRVGKYSYSAARKLRAPYALNAVNSGSTLKVLEGDPGARRRDLSPVGFIAVEMLANIAGEASINNYWKALGKSSWQTAFEQAFGIKVDDFYVRFDGWREKGFEPRLKPKP
jgi:hypothetical protein